MTEQLCKLSLLLALLIVSTNAKPTVTVARNADGKTLDLSANCPKDMDVHIDPLAMKAFNEKPDRDSIDALYLLLDHATCVAKTKKAKP